MRHKTQITFTKKYSKLSKTRYTTVRWLDSIYLLGMKYPVYLIGDNHFHNRYGKGMVRIVGLEITKLSHLTEEFCQHDADCNRAEFFVMMKKWYEKKPDWKGGDSEVQVLTLERVA